MGVRGTHGRRREGDELRRGHVDGEREVGQRQGKKEEVSELEEVGADTMRRRHVNRGRTR